MKTHELKIWPQWFDAVRLYTKNFEVRRDDRGFAVGDVLVLQEFKPGTGTYTGRELRRRVRYVLRASDAAEHLGGELVGVKDGFVVLGLEASDAK